VKDINVGFHVVGYSGEQHDRLGRVVNAMESGRYLARDLGDPDCERMTPLKFAEHVAKVFHGRVNVKVTIKNDVEYLKREYPCLTSVARASLMVHRHWPCVVRLEYTGEGETKETLYFAGKGVTYDTGGADVKVGGSMAGMSRDKCGASNIAGFLLTTSILSPRNIKVVAELGMVRNSIGSNAYVSDEVLTSHAGVRVRITNTDAEGRMVLIDLLSHLREEALNSVNPKLMSMATLTGHAVRSYGCYTATLDNGPARQALISKQMQSEGELWGDPFEVSTIRKDDYDAIKPKNSTYDVNQQSHNPGITCPRSHQTPTAVIIVGSGLSNHGIDSQNPLCYTHFDIAGSACENTDFTFGKVTACCIVPLTSRYILPNVNI